MSTQNASDDATGRCGEIIRPCARFKRPSQSLELCATDSTILNEPPSNRCWRTSHAAFEVYTTAACSPSTAMTGCSPNLERVVVWSSKKPDSGAAWINLGRQRQDDWQQPLPAAAAPPPPDPPADWR